MTNSFGARDTFDGGRDGNAVRLGAGAFLDGRTPSERVVDDEEGPAPDRDQGVELMLDGVANVLACLTGGVDEAACATRSHTRRRLSLA